jgi:hypothetical protein
LVWEIGIEAVFAVFALLLLAAFLAFFAFLAAVAHVFPLIILKAGPNGRFVGGCPLSGLKAAAPSVISEKDHARLPVQLARTA